MVTKERTGTRAYFMTIYRDEVDNASVESIGLGYDLDIETAIGNVRAIIGERIAFDPRWKLWSATVDEGWEVPWRPEPGVVLSEFEEDEHGRRWYFGPDWFEVETR